MLGIDVVDVHEGDRVVAALERLDIDVRVEALTSGDYIVGRGCGVERKTVNDLHLSLAGGRLWQQLGRFRQAYRWRYLIVEGEDIDLGPMRKEAVRGALLATMEQGVRVLQARDLDDSAVWLQRLAYRCQRRKSRNWPIEAPEIFNRTEGGPAVAMLATVPGISTVTAHALLAEFGSAQAVFEASPEQWQQVRGMGPRRAEDLATVLRLSPPPSPPAKAQSHPST